MEWASSINQGNEMVIFVTEWYSFNDEMAIVIEWYSFSDELFASQMRLYFVIAWCSVRLPNAVCHAGSWRVLHTWHVHVVGDVDLHVAADVATEEHHVADDVARCD